MKTMMKKCLSDRLQLESLPGVGRKAANVVLINAISMFQHLR